MFTVAYLFDNDTDAISLFLAAWCNLNKDWEASQSAGGTVPPYAWNPSLLLHFPLSIPVTVPAILTTLLSALSPLCLLFYNYLFTQYPFDIEPKVVSAAEIAGHSPSSLSTSIATYRDDIKTPQSIWEPHLVDSHLHLKYQLA